MSAQRLAAAAIAENPRNFSFSLASFSLERMAVRIATPACAIYLQSCRPEKFLVYGIRRQSGCASNAVSQPSLDRSTYHGLSCEPTAFQEE